MKVLVTGATGFVGSYLVDRVLSGKHHVVTATRNPHCSSNTENYAIGSIGPASRWQEALRDCDAVVHLAARVHVMNDKMVDSLASYREINVQGTLNLARQAAINGIRRFIYLSSIKVNGDGHSSGSNVHLPGGIEHPYSEADAPAPTDPYGQSKWEAEEGLRCIANSTSLECVIIRPPLIYGPGVRANFLRLMQWVETGVPLPFDAVDNRRSLVYVGNLTNAIEICLGHPDAARQTFIVSDGNAISTAELIRKLARYLRRPARLLPIPASLLNGCLALLGKRDEANRLLGSLVVDDSHIRNMLGWCPPYSIDQGLMETVNAFRKP